MIMQAGDGALSGFRKYRRRCHPCTFEAKRPHMIILHTPLLTEGYAGDISRLTAPGRGCH